MTSTPQFLYSWQWIPKEEEGSFSFVDILWITHPSLTLYMKNIIRIKKKLSLENVKIIETNLVGKPETNSPCVFKYSCFSCGQITHHTVFFSSSNKNPGDSYCIYLLMHKIIPTERLQRCTCRVRWGSNQTQSEQTAQKQVFNHTEQTNTAL